MVSDISSRNVFVKVQNTEMSWLLFLLPVLICVDYLNCKTLKKRLFSAKNHVWKASVSIKDKLKQILGNIFKKIEIAYGNLGVCPLKN